MLHLREEYAEALRAELELRKDYLQGEKISTIYFGGGTPSLLHSSQIELILQKIRGLFEVEDKAEITIEANPGDLNREHLQKLRETGVNRLSIGIQSFDNKNLRLLGRRHTAEEAKEAVRTAQEAGFDNISIDLIYGIPEQTVEQWEEELRQALQLNVQHISTYCLSYEEGTKMTMMLKKGEIDEVDDETENEMYDVLVNTLKENGFAHYEVSNFAKQDCYSRHNSSYWNGIAYLGVGAGAHSYDGKTRQWNISEAEEYIRQVKAQNLQHEIEVLTEQDKYNEQIMLSLRTAGGIDLQKLTEQQRAYCMEQAATFVANKQLRLTENRIVATMKGINILNMIIEHLMQ